MKTTRQEFLLILAVSAVITGCLSWRGSDTGPETGQAGTAGLRFEEPLPAEPDRVWTTPKGRQIASGTVDELGYVLPLDIRRPKAPKVSAERPPQWKIELQRELGPPSSFSEVRVGPDEGHTQNETSIDVEGSTLITGWNQFTDDSLVMGAGRSIDGAATWDWELFDGHTFMSDPAVKSGGGGVWYFGYLAAGGAGGGDVDIYIRRSINDGATWQAPIPATNNTGFDDKPYIDARGDEVLVAWADFSFSPAKVRVTRSLDGGQTFDNDTILANNSVGGNGACPIIAADGTYYVFWRDSFQEFLWMSRSFDQGVNWTPDESIVEMDPLAATQPGGFRMVNLPAVAEDPLTGDVVVVWNDQLFGNADILAIRSGDGGDSWSAPVRVNDDAGTDAQFLPWIDADEAGVFHAVWYDRRGDGSDIDVYYSSSTDGGATWQANTRITAAAFTPVLPWEGGAADFIGDYNAIAAAGGFAYPFYQDARSGIQDVYVSVVPTTSIFTDGFESGDTSSWSTTTP